MTTVHTTFEQGPIRPPNEARSLLLRLTRNCPWNQCLFCPVYKRRKFSLRSVTEIKDDIRHARNVYEDLRALSWKLGFSGEINDAVVSAIYSEQGYSPVYRSVAAWAYYGTGACFLQDADNLVMSTAAIVEVLAFLRETFPEIQRVTTYARSRTIIRKSIDALKKIQAAGLDRIHVGLESGYDPLLKLMKKGVSAAQHVEAGQRVIAAGMELSEYIMPGLGGRAMWRQHAVQTAVVLNRINPHFIRLRSLRVPAKVPLYEKLADGSFKMLSDDMLAEEIRVLIQHLDGISSTLTSDHIMNLLEDVSGKLPGDKARMLAVIEKYQQLSDTDRLIYRVGRRGGTYRSTDDLQHDPQTYAKIQRLVDEVMAKEGAAGMEKFIAEMVDRYV